jgi:RNase adaptor protein for sRNA GlmZ degradation
MPTGPKGQKRHADVNRNAVMIAKVATGEVEDYVPTPEEEGKDPAAVALGRRGGKARAAGMTAKRRKEIAENAAKSRWKK